MLFISALFLSFLVTLFLAQYAWARREIPAAKAVAGMMAGISWWTLFYAIQLLRGEFPELVPQPDAMPLFWFRLMFVGVRMLPASMLAFVLLYTGVLDRLRRRTIVLLGVVPVFIVIIALTDGIYHDWFLAGFSAAEGQRFRGGPAFWFHTLYSYALTLVAYGLLVRFIVRSRAYRVQAAVILAGSLASSVANMLTILQLVPEPLKGLDVSPFGFVITAVVMLLNVRNQGFLDVMPIARSLVFEHMADAILVTDRRGRLVDRNPAARSYFETANRVLDRGEAIGHLLPGLFANGRMVPEIEVDGRCFSVQKNEFHGSGGGVRGVVYGFRDVTALKQTEANLREQLARNEELSQALKEESIRDPLTGLYNRRWLDEVLEREIPRALREKRPLSFCLIDLDHFKRVNDTWGHDVGDDILRALARLLTNGSRKHDVAARFGGEEFVLVLPGLGVSRGRAVVERLLEDFSHLQFGPDGPSGLTFSAGLAVVPDHATDRDSLFRMADRALYRAKDQGRNRVVVQGDA